MKTFTRSKKNLKQDGNNILSYGTHVATIVSNELHQLGYWSVTTQPHINLAARELGLTLVK